MSLNYTHYFENLVHHNEKNEYIISENATTTVTPKTANFSVILTTAASGRSPTTEGQKNSKYNGLQLDGNFNKNNSLIPNRILNLK